ncbi:fungal-specific transcription factor domain-containing protein [Elsinoe ampelina]|uniref:Fungal-specific transcription factor domain-containing protein n=1 Tax=Elsinoe ampelina TaxID=302913 RepID=A0A6A6GK49_9PEZI|nr:fungal-specific transcription factor domain-containing protein [Elsinoe ampelina]
MMSARKSSASRTRSFTGCVTCRNRHIKCDEKRPECRNCGKSGLECEGYGSALHFINHDGSGTGAFRVRRHLLSESARKRMSESIVTAINFRDATSCLQQIDQCCDAAARETAFSVQHGPFGAFAPVLDSTSTSPPADELAEETSDLANPLIPDFAADLSMSPWSPGRFAAFIDQFGQDAELPSFSHISPFQGASRIEEIDETHDGGAAAESTALDYPVGVIDMAWSDYQQSPLTPSLSICTSLASVPENSVYLLKHYTTTVIALLTPFKHAKTPWHVVFLPHVKQSLASLTLQEALDHASMTVFYGTLAISAFSLGGTYQSCDWTEKGRMFRRRAQEHASLMLTTSFVIPKTSKYKTILMALLTMVRLSVVCGDQSQADAYLLESEKLIRLKGLPLIVKSRKRRLLHHVYAFERFLHESTYMPGNFVDRRLHVHTSVTASEPVQGQDSGIFRLPPLSDLDQEMMRIKSVEEGENDLHLERPGVWTASLYAEIFGTNEEWFLLLSLVIRLGNEKDEAGSGDLPALKAFLDRAKSVERCINQLQKTISPVPNDSFSGLLLAMAQGLSIYFYRRIYDVDTQLLQPLVMRIREYLNRRRLSDEGLSGSLALTWTSFIAGCEAEDPNVRDDFKAWFQHVGRSSGLSSFDNALSTIEKVWAEKETSLGKNKSWLDLIKDKQLQWQV